MSQPSHFLFFASGINHKAVLVIAVTINIPTNIVFVVTSDESVRLTAPVVALCLRIAGVVSADCSDTKGVQSKILHQKTKLAATPRPE